MNKIKKLKWWVWLIIIGLIVIVGVFITYNNLLKSVSNNSEEVTFTIESGTSANNIVTNLKNADLIKNEEITMLYIRFQGDIFLQAGTYSLDRNMTTQEIIEILSNGKIKTDTVMITFKEGKRVTDYVQTASEVLNLDYEESINLVNNQEYLKSLVDSDKYWFLTNDILNEKLYYGLEGYLFPETYEFNKTATIEDVVAIMLNQMALKLEPFKDDIENHDLSIHEILTLASIVESEAKTTDDRKNVSSVFLNRIASGWSLGSDVTTYYGSHKVFGDVLTIADLNDCNNGYNTRCTSFIGLSIGPISNPSISSIEATINPTPNNYMYFVADCTGKSYFNVNEYGHNQTISQLINENNWCV